ncbi:MAG: M13-type metalloendopeptidase [Clostridia bacterium]
MKTKKIIALLIAAMTAISASYTAAATGGDYVTRGEAAEMLQIAADDYNPQIKKSDIIKGYEDGELHEDETVTRAQALVMLKRAFGDLPELKGNNLRIAIPKESFSDIPEWAETELTPIFDAGIAAGTGDGKFSPDDPVTTEQMKTFINRVYTLYGSNLKDSFYATVNKTDLENLEIPAGNSIAGTIYSIRDQSNIQVSELIKEISVSNPKSGSAQEKIKILYDCFMDVKARNEAGYTPIAEDLKTIEKIQSVSELSEILIMDGSASALSIMTEFTLGIDNFDSGKYITILSPASADQTKQVYEGKAETQKNAYLKYLAALLTLCGEDEKSAEKDAKAFFEFEKQLSDASLTIAEQYDLEKTYNIYTLDELKDIFSTVDLETEFLRTGLKDSGRVLVSDKGKMTQLAKMLTDENIDEIKNYLKMKLIITCSKYFGEDFRNVRITYYKEAYGIVGEKTMEEDAAGIIAEILPDYVGQAYAEKYCTEEIIYDVRKMVNDIIEVYRKRISALDWMSEKTKSKAILKLDSMRIHIGAPDYGKIASPLDTAVFKSSEDGGSYFYNAMEIKKAIQRNDARLSGESVDKDQWITTPQTVNAFYFPSFNSITFPMAFLQYPVYDKNASYEENLGALGSVISHEITHAFDSEGSQYDENGNAVNWWSEEDKIAFAKLCENVVSFFDGQESAPGIAIDGTLTLTENIADLGALSCITEIGSQTENFDFKKMYASYARLWLSTASREYLQSMAYEDVHSSNKVRTDRVLQSLDKFYEVYEIGENDGMYVPPEERVRIW